MTTRRQRAAAGAVVVAVLAGVLALHGGDWSSRHPRVLTTGQAAASNVVAVLPFQVSNSDPALLDLRDWIQDLLAARLFGEGSPQALDPSLVYEALRNGDHSPEGELTLDASLRLGTELGVGQVLRGEVAGTPARLSLDAALLAVPSGAERAHARVDGSADSLPSLADRLVVRLLAAHAARDSAELAAVGATSLPALRAYLEGIHAERRGRGGFRSEAIGHFERALFLDSTFVLAGLRLAEIAAVYGMGGLDERWKLDAIWKERHRLAPAELALLTAYVGPRYPRPATLAELIAASERAALAAPHRLEAWRIAGVQLFLLGSMIGYPEWQARAAEALRHAFAVDSTDAFTLHYLLWLAAGAGDSATVRQYARLYLTYNPTSDNADFIRWLAAVVLSDSAGLAALRSRLGEMHGFSLRAIIDWSTSSGVGLEDADRAARFYVVGDKGVPPRYAVAALVPFMLNRGRPGEASRLLATAEQGFGQRGDVGVLEFRTYAALYWNGSTTEADAATRSLEAYLDGAPVRPGQVIDRQTASCALAHWRLAAGDLAGTQTALQGIRRVSDATGPYAIESTPVCVAAVEAQLAAALRRPDAVAALERLDTLLRTGSDVRQLIPSMANLVAARLYEARGDLRHALAITRRRTSWANQLLSTHLREEGRLAALVGDHAGAVRAYRHYLALRSDPEPALRPEVERVRAELARLDRVSEQHVRNE